MGSLFRGSIKSYVSTKSLGEERRTTTKREEKYKKRGGKTNWLRKL